MGGVFLILGVVGESEILKVGFHFVYIFKIDLQDASNLGKSPKASMKIGFSRVVCFVWWCAPSKGTLGV